MSDFTDADYERMAKWCERPDGTVPYNAICRLFESLRPLRAQVATLTAELARVKALVTEGQTVGYYVYVSEHQNAYLVEDADEAIDDLTNHGAQITELIARPNLNLEQKP